jgi:hypothetical protein
MGPITLANTRFSAHGGIIWYGVDITTNPDGKSGTITAKNVRIAFFDSNRQSQIVN